MDFNPVVFTFVLTFLARLVDADEVCFQHLGCFSNEPPFDNAGVTLPSSPEVVATEFRLFHRGWDEFVLLDYLDPGSDGARAFDARLKTKIIIHGLAADLDRSQWITRMISSLLQQGNYNVIAVGWNTEFPNYLKAVANTRLVAKVTTVLVEQLQRAKGLNLSKVHIIGHSLGAQIAGHVGTLLGSKIARVTGLDPAGPLFDGFSADVAIDPSDAIFVDVIHSNGHPLNLNVEGFGSSLASGHIDFYPNGGAHQPGCGDGLNSAVATIFRDIVQHQLTNLTTEAFGELSCSHGRSYEAFIESIDSSSCQFLAIPCDTYEEFKSGKCTDCGPEGCNIAGFYAQRNVGGRTQYFETLEDTPLCGYMYVATIVPEGETNALSGTITASFTSDAGEVNVALSSGPIPMSAEEPYKTIIIVEKDLGSVTNVVLHFKKHDIGSRREFKVRQFELEKLGTGQKFTTTSEPFQLTTKIDANQKMTRTKH